MVSLRVIDPAKPLSRPPDRVLVAGGSGAGKTTVAGKLAALYELPRIELDELYYGPDWSVRPEFADRVAQAAEGARWVTEWHYPEVNGLLASRAELLVWLDYSTALTMTSLVLRTLLRSLHREALWSGNQEAPLRSVFTDPENILRYGWSTRHETRHELRALARAGAGADPGAPLDMLRFTRPADLSDWLIRLAQGRSTSASRAR
ncbi:P-loop NTPase family protein [Streptomyces albireticuli]|uniref:adenylate kinase n=1 Tax=Streptomyces albireticuli TaxID=1940 RepID=UPI00368CF421